MFAVEHVAPEPAVGYRVIETRRRLKPEFESLPQPEVEHRARTQGRDSVMESYTHTLFAHSGDAMPVAVEYVRDADLMVHDATFLEAADRREPIHAASDEVFALACAARVRALVLTHLSIRYERAMALAKLHQQRAASRFTGDAWLLDEGTFHPL